MYRIQFLFFQIPDTYLHCFVWKWASKSYENESYLSEYQNYIEFRNQFNICNIDKMKKKLFNLIIIQTLFTIFSSVYGEIEN